MVIRIATYLFIFLVLTCVHACFLSAQSPPRAFPNTAYGDAPDEVNVLRTSGARKIVDLNGEWQVRLGNSKIWTAVYVPSSIDYNGILHFKRSFMLPEDSGKYHVRLTALSINYQCTVKINGTYVGAHAMGFTRISFDVLQTVILPGRENVIEIDVDGRTGYKNPALPRPQPWAWKSYSGIIREIYLEFQPRLSITHWSLDYVLSPSLRDCTATLKFLIQNFYQSEETSGSRESSSIQQENIQEIGYYVEVFNRKTGALVKTTAASPKFIQVHRAVEDTVRLLLHDVALWTPEDPVQYSMRITVINRRAAVLDRVTAAFGFRTVAFRNDGFYLNGRKSRLQGVYRIEQHPEFGISLPYEAQKQDLLMIKNLGLNAVRSGPYPNHPYFYDLCDELGILALEEIPVSQVPARFIDDAAFLDRAVLNLKNTIDRDRLHPSIIGWGIGSNLDVTNMHTAAYVAAMRDAAKALDSRPVYYSSEIAAPDRCLEYADFKLLDTYSPSREQLTRIFNELSGGSVKIPVLIGRIGPVVFTDNLGGYLNPTSLAHQAKYITDVYNFARASENIPGVFFWSFADWRGEVPALSAGTDYHDNVYTRGLVTDKRIERPAFSYLKAAVNKQQLSPLTMGASPDESLQSIIFAGFSIILIALIALKRQRWFGQNFRRSLLFAKTFFGDVLDRRNIHVSQTILLGLCISAGIALGIAGCSFYYKRNVYFDLILSQFIINSGLKQLAVYLIWHPVANSVVFTLLLMGMIMFIAFLYSMVLSLLGLNRGFSFSLDMIIWPGSHMVFLIPLTMSLYSALQHNTSIYFFLAFFLLFLAFYAVRFIIALKVCYGTHFVHAIIGIASLLILFWGAVAFYFQNTYQSFTYLNHFITVAQSQIE